MTMTPATKPVAPAMAGEEFWARGWFWALLALLSTAPFVIAPLPMMPDYFSHIGRYHIMNHGRDSAWLRQYYGFHWALIGNLGVDLLMVPLGRLFGTETAAVIAVASIPPLTIAGLYAVSRAVWGRIEAPVCLALPFVFSFTFLFGFVNYHLSMALALLGVALWIGSAGWPALRRWGVFALVGGVVWLAHVAGWAIMLVLIGCWELVTAWRGGRGVVGSVFTAAGRVVPVALPLVALVLWRSGSGSGAGALPTRDDFGSKLDWIAIVLRSEYLLADVATVLALVAAAVWLGFDRRVRRDYRILLGAAALGLCFVLLPRVVFASYYADARLLPAFAMALFLGFAVPAGRARTLVAMFGLAIFGARLAATTIGWHQRGTAAVADLAVLEGVPRGSRIAVMAVPTACDDWQLRGLDHLASLAIVRREAFVNNEWDIAGSQLMRPLYNRDHGFNEIGSTIIEGRGASCGGKPLAVLLGELPRDRFDYVWVFDAAADLPWLRLVAAGPHGRLYAVGAG